MIMIKGGTLTDESFDKLQQYMNDIKGAAGQHAFIILETESSEGRVDFDQSEKPEIEVKDLANILQKDELFQDYLDNNRRKVQSSFSFPTFMLDIRQTSTGPQRRQRRRSRRSRYSSRSERALRG